MFDEIKTKALLKKYALTVPQMGILRDAAAKYDSNGSLRNGEVSTYNVRADSLSVLKDRGFIENGYKISDPTARDRIKAEAVALIEEAFVEAAKGEPFQKTKEPDERDGIVRWMVVKINLDVAKGKLGSLDEKVLRLTESGRNVAVEWKQAVKAEEE